MDDVRDALRALRSAPIVSVVAIVSLALGIGANSAIFSIVDSLLLKALPVEQPEQLVLVTSGNGERTDWTGPIWEAIRARAGRFGGALAWSSTRFNLASGGETDLVDGFWASDRLFDVLGVPAVLGRTFTAAADDRGGPDGPVAVISHGFWQRRFGGAADVIGRTLTVEGVSRTSVGITPPGFFGLDVGRTFDVAIPLGRDLRLDSRSYWWLNVMLRLKEGQDIERAQATLQGVQSQIRSETLPHDWRPQDLDGYLRDGVGAAARGVARRAWCGRRDGGVFVGFAVRINAALWARPARFRHDRRRDRYPRSRGNTCRLAAGAARIADRSDERTQGVVRAPSVVGRSPSSTDRCTDTEWNGSGPRPAVP